MVTGGKAGGTRKTVETRAESEFLHGCLEFSQTFTSVTITLWKLGKKVFNKRLETFLLWTGGFQSISERVVFFFFFL